MREKFTLLTRRLDEMEMTNQHKMHSVNELSTSQPSCYNCQSNGHYGEHCQENVQILNQGRSPMNAPFGNSNHHNWKNYSNIPGKPKPPAYIPPAEQQQFRSTSTAQQVPPLSSPVEQSILNLSKVVGIFVEEQKVLNVQTSQKIEEVESSLNRKLDNMHFEIQNCPISSCKVQKKGRVPSRHNNIRKW